MWASKFSGQSIENKTCHWFFGNRNLLHGHKYERFCDKVAKKL